MPSLPYAETALEPKMSKETLEYHHGKHHQTYYNTLNTLIKDTEFENMPLEEIVKKSDGKIFNNAAQALNHDIFFAQFTEKPQAQPSGKLADAITRDFGSFDKLKEEMTNAASTLFGSGWAWLSKDSNGKLSVSQESNAGSPLTKGKTPILTIDVWEHAYYIDYRNKRPDYIAAFWQILDWKEIEKRY